MLDFAYIIFTFEYEIAISISLSLMKWLNTCHEKIMKTVFFF